MSEWLKVSSCSTVILEPSLLSLKGAAAVTAMAGNSIEKESHVDRFRKVMVCGQIREMQTAEV